MKTQQTTPAPRAPKALSARLLAKLQQLAALPPKSRARLLWQLNKI